MMYLDLAEWKPDYPPAAPGISYRRITPESDDPDRSDALRIISEVFDTPPFPMSRWTNENPAESVREECHAHEGEVAAVGG